MDVLAQLTAALSDRYRVERELGHGGMAVVFLAQDLKHPRQVAIKVLKPELSAALGGDRFLREIGIAAALQHPHVLPLYDSGQAGGLLYYVMPYAEGESLRQRLAREGQLPLGIALAITGEVGGALQYAHEHGIVHRDIKPENIMLSGGQAVVADFGIARALSAAGAAEHLTVTGIVVGTPHYMSPEQAAGGAVDGRSDQYSLGCTLYEMLIGEPPFSGPSPQAVAARHSMEPVPSMRLVRQTVPQAVEGAVLRAMAKSPADRFPAMRDFLDALRAPEAAAVPTVVSHPAPAAHGAPSRRGLLIALGFGALVAAGTWRFMAGRPAAGGDHASRPVAAVAVVGRRSAAAETSDPAAVALYRRGVRAYEQRTPTSIGDAIESFAAAVARDSTYADAWSGLAKAYVRAYERRFVFPGVARDSVLRLAVKAADRALEEDSGSAEAWATRAGVSRIVDPTDRAAAIRALRRALELDSTNAGAWHVLALSLAESGDVDGAFTAWRRVIAVNPADVQGLTFLGIAHYWRRQYDSSIHYIDSAIALDPTFQMVRIAAGHTEVERGEFDRARAAFEAAERLSTDVEVLHTLAGRALTAARAGASGEARGLLQQAESLAAGYTPTPLHAAVWIAEAYAGLRDADRTVEWLGRFRPAADLHFQIHLRCDPSFQPIEEDARFRSLLLTPRPAGARGC